MQKAPAVGQLEVGPLPLLLAGNLLEMFDRPTMIANRAGRLLLANHRAQESLNSHGLAGNRVNLFQDLFQLDSHAIFGQLESGEHEVLLPLTGPDGKGRAQLRWLPQPDWLIITLLEALRPAPPDNPEVQQTLQDLLEEREITYRNLLAAYLRLQEVNRQKTLFLASAAHELKTPLAVMKGYYDLLLSNSLGKMNDRQHEILQESKESCERLIRLVSMFLNYSALESGKLVLHLHENDIRDCTGEVVARWQDAFQRKNVRLEIRLDRRLAPIKFDYPKVMQTIANLLDNALKHTPPGGRVTLSAEPHFWERRVKSGAPALEQRRARRASANSILVSVSDTGAGIAPEYHQEIFEDFVRVDRSSSGMGLGLAIAKRLVQAHRGKIWVDSEPGSGCTVSFVLPRDAD